MPEPRFASEYEFHTARRMFACTADGSVLVATAGDPRSHFEWLAGLFGLEAAGKMIRDNTRGYVLDRRLVAYRGAEFSHRVNHTHLVHAVDLFDRATPGGLSEVGLGAGYAGDPQPWPPRVTYPANEYYARVTRKIRDKVPVDADEE